jgi:putative flippase GtrA
MFARPSAFQPVGPADVLLGWFLSPHGRALRFAMIGGLAGLTQIGLLQLFTDQGMDALLANAIAFIMAAQLNFVLSSVFTWADRRPAHAMWRRWSAFHGSIASMAVVNMIVFALARTVMPDLAASATGIGAAAMGNFFIGDRLVFRSHPDAKREDRLPQ